MKLTALVLSLALSLPLAACGGGGGGDDDNNNNNNPLQDTIISTANLDGLLQFTNVNPANVGGSASPPIVGDQVFVASGGTFIHEGLWSFDVSSIPSNATITSATLRLRITGIAGDPTDMMAQGFVDHVNYGNTFPTTRGAVVTIAANFAQIVDMNTLGERLVNVAAQLQDDIDSARPRSQFRLRGGVSTDNDPQADFSVLTDAENATAANRPALIIEYTTP